MELYREYRPTCVEKMFRGVKGKRYDGRIFLCPPSPVTCCARHGAPNRSKTAPMTSMREDSTRCKHKKRLFRYDYNYGCGGDVPDRGHNKNYNYSRRTCPTGHACFTSGEHNPGSNSHSSLFPCPFCILPRHGHFSPQLPIYVLPGGSIDDGEVSETFLKTQSEGRGSERRRKINGAPPNNSECRRGLSFSEVMSKLRRTNQTTGNNEGPTATNVPHTQSRPASFKEERERETDKSEFHSELKTLLRQIIELFSHWKPSNTHTRPQDQLLEESSTDTGVAGMAPPLSRMLRYIGRIAGQSLRNVPHAAAKHTSAKDRDGLPHDAQNAGTEDAVRQMARVILKIAEESLDSVMEPGSARTKVDQIAEHSESARNSSHYRAEDGVSVRSPRLRPSEKNLHSEQNKDERPKRADDEWISRQAELVTLIRQMAYVLRGDCQTAFRASEEIKNRPEAADNTEHPSEALAYDKKLPPISPDRTASIRTEQYVLDVPKRISRPQSRRTKRNRDPSGIPAVEDTFGLGEEDTTRDLSYSATAGNSSRGQEEEEAGHFSETYGGQGDTHSALDSLRPSGNFSASPARHQLPAAHSPTSLPEKKRAVLQTSNNTRKILFPRLCNFISSRWKKRKNTLNFEYV
ncbi:hypothetical protein AAG570_002139 [Ranatra chinensis]|uniref:Uncharacterized protein n=1 Tax=Ranatra chinensis TaxID=642074 RepID=A0ABD0Y759_9HEMI